MATPALSACSSTTTLVPASMPMVLIPENIPEVPEILVVETLNETMASDHGPDSDESLDIIDKDSVVCSEDLPTGVELEKRVRSDWKSRRGFDFPGTSSSDSFQKQGDGIDADRGRSALKIPGRLIIDPDTRVVEDNVSPTSPTKRRFLSLAPLRTILSPRLMSDPDRPMSAHPSPCSSPYAASSRNIFFRSSTSLVTSSLMKLPLSPGKNDNSVPRKLFAKGKEKLESWEVLDEENYPDEYTGAYPSSLMSAIHSLKLATPDVGNSPARSQSFSTGVRSLVSPCAEQPPNSCQDGATHSIVPQTHQNTSLRDRKGFAGALLDRKLWHPPASASTATGNSMAVPPGTDSPPARPHSPVTHPRVPSPSPGPLISKHTVPPIHPSPLRPAIATGDQGSSITYQQALDTPLPTTPVFRTHFDVMVNGAGLNDQETRPVPNDSFSAGDVCTCRSTPPMPSLSLGTANCPAQINFTEEPMSPNRHHYTGRPLPRPPPNITRSNVDSTFAPGVPVYDADRESSSTGCPEGLLINLDDTSLDYCSTSGASTPHSDEPRLRSQLHLPRTPSSSAIELTMDAASQRSPLSDSTLHGSEVNGLFEATELDLLVSRLADGESDGSDYEVSAGYPRWLAPGLNNRPDLASGLRDNWPSKPNPSPTIYLPESQYQRQHVAHWAN